MISDKQLTRLIQEHNSLRHQADELATRINAIKGTLKEDLIGASLTSREVEDPDTSSRYRVILVEPESLVYDDEALIKLLKEKKLWTRCQTVLVDRPAVEEVVREGKVTVGEMDKVSHLESRTPYVKVSPVKGGRE